MGIDPQSRKHILDSVRELHEQGATILYTTHYMEEAEELCTRIAIMDQGRVIALGTTDELKELVSSEERIVIEVAAAGYTLVEQIKKLHGVRECGLAEKTLTVMAARNSGMVRRLIDLITAAGTEIVSLNVERITLESVFLTLTGRTLRD